MFGNRFKSKVAGAAVVFAFFGASAGIADSSSQNENGLPEQLNVSVYSVGSGTYNDVAAIAEAFTNEYGVKVRLMPSDTGIGRMTPIKAGQALIARTGEEYYHAFEGINDFTNSRWGPQDVRIVWSTSGVIGMAVPKNSAIKELSDLKGKSLPTIVANASVNNKLDAYLAVVGLTRDDVNLVPMNYSEQADALKNGRIDAAIYNPYASQMFEFDATIGVRWLSIEGATDEDRARLSKVAPTVSIEAYENAAGMEKGDGAFGVAYALPIVAYADADEEELTGILEALQYTYDDYKNSTTTAIKFSIDKANTFPLAVPFHEASVEFLKKNNVWSSEAQIENDRLIARGAALRLTWQDYLKTIKNPSAETWLDWVSKNLTEN